VSVSVAILSNFTWNRFWTYPESRTRKKRKQLPQFVLINIVGLLINNLIVVGLDALLVPHIGEPWSYNLAKAVAIGVVLFWNFGINRLWTYRGL
jgi:putative flippase GtrA